MKQDVIFRLSQTEHAQTGGRSPSSTSRSAVTPDGVAPPVAPERGHSLLPSPPCFIHRRLGTASLVWVSLRASVISSDGTGSIDCSFSAQLSPPQGRWHLKMHPLPSWSGRHLTVDYLTCTTLHTETTNIMQHVANVSFSAVQPFFFSFLFIRLSIIWSKLWVNEVDQLSSHCFSAFFKLIFEVLHT